MSDLQGAISSIEELFKSSWPNADVPVEMPGLVFDKPDGPWLRLSTMMGDGAEITMGALTVGQVDVVGVVHVRRRRGRAAQPAR